jgi:hypothetical protein
MLAKAAIITKMTGSMTLSRILTEPPRSLYEYILLTDSRQLRKNRAASFAFFDHIGAFFAVQKTGLSAPIFSPPPGGKKDFRCNPLRPTAFCASRNLILYREDTRRCPGGAVLIFLRDVLCLFKPFLFKENCMRKIVLCAAILCLAAGAGFSQTPTLDNYKDGIEDFAEDLAGVLPMNSAIGLNWNDAYIGQITDAPPHFGLGVTSGFTTLPYKTIKNLVEDAMGRDAEDIPDAIRRIGVPIPAATIDARIGGFVLPFDFGLKFGYLDFDSEDLKVDYLLLGTDVRYRLLEQTALIPKISVGLGFNYMKSKATLSDALGDDVTINTTDYSSYLNGITAISLSSPDLYLEMKTKVIDFKVQASWKALIFEPSIGLGVSYGMSEVSAGAESILSTTGGTGTVDDAIQVLNGLGYDIDGASIGYTKKVNAFAYRLFGGLGLNLMIFRLDLGLLYGMNTGSWGASVGARVQL